MGYAVLHISVAISQLHSKAPEGAGGFTVTKKQLLSEQW